MLKQQNPWCLPLANHVLQVIFMNFFWNQHGFLFSQTVYLAVYHTSSVSSKSTVERNNAFNQMQYIGFCLSLGCLTTLGCCGHKKLKNKHCLPETVQSRKEVRLNPRTLSLSPHNYRRCLVGEKKYFLCQSQFKLHVMRI